MGIFYADPAFLEGLEGLNGEQYYEVLSALQQIETKIDLEMQVYESSQLQQFADYEILGNTPQGRTYINTGTRMSGPYNPPYQVSQTETALEVANEAYDAAVLDANGNIIYKYSNARGAMETAPGAETYKTVSLLSLDVGAVGAAVAPLAGVALGYGLYKSNETFWTKLSQKLLPFCYPGTTKIPGWLDIIDTLSGKEAHAVIDRRILITVEDFLSRNGYGKFSRQATLEDVGSVSYATSIYHTNTINTHMQVGNGAVGVIYEGNPQRSLFTRWFSLSNTATMEYGVEGGTTRTITLTERLMTLSDDRVVYTTPSGFSPAGISRNDLIDGPAIIPYEDYHSLGIQGIARIIFQGTSARKIPDGAEEWDGDDGSTQSYSKPIVYMKEDPNNPGHFILESQEGIEIAVPKKTISRPRTKEPTRPEDWPEDESWPTEMEFPWPEPSDYTGEQPWPTTMPWPLPNSKPKWWPNVLPYPITITDTGSVDSNTNPDPNRNSDKEDILPYVETSFPGTSPASRDNPDSGSGSDDDPDPDPGDEDNPYPTPDDDPNPPPDPSENPSGGTKPPNSITPTDDSDNSTPSNPPGIVIPPSDDGVTPPYVPPTVPVPFTSQNDGLISVYHPTDAQLKSFASWLWVTYADPSIEKLWNNPFDGVIGLMEIYCTPTDVGTKTIRSGFLDSGVSSAIISRYTSINCGTVFVPEFYKNYFDYSPYSKAHIYLPFIGIVELNVDDVVGHGINVTYCIDEYNGSCIAQITTAKYVEVNGEAQEYSSITYQFSGNCAVELPLAGGSQAAIRAAMMQAAAYGLSSVVGGIATGMSGNISGAISQIGYGAANAVGSIVSAKSSVQHSGSFGSSFGAMGLKKPFILVSRPKAINIVNYPALYGLPAHCSVTIGACSGYLRVREVNVKSSTASNEEKAKIEQMLKEGVYV